MSISSSRRARGHLRLALILVALSLPLVIKTAHAQDSAAAADVLFNDARAAMVAKKFDVACAKFRESNRLDPAVGTLFNLANCEAQRGHLVASWALYRRVLEKLQPDDPRASVAKAQVQLLDARVPRLTIRARGEMPADTTVNVAGYWAGGPLLVLSPDSLNSPLPLDPGSYAISVVAPGRATREFSVTLAEGDAAEFPVFVGSSTSASPPRVAPAAVVTPSQPIGAGDDDDRKTRELLAYAGIGVGAAGITLGIITGLFGLHEEALGNPNCSDATRTCNQRGYDANQSAKSLATVSTLGFVVGVLAGGAGTYLWLTLPDAKSGAVGTNGTTNATLLGLRGRW
ncbi:MAG TPA: hypothetical protein VIK01_10425 [Polyangiaceae bacterium]